MKAMTKSKVLLYKVKTTLVHRSLNLPVCHAEERVMSFRKNVLTVHSSSHPLLRERLVFYLHERRKMFPLINWKI